jgi:hypothetical protein
LYEKVFDRLKAIYLEGQPPRVTWAARRRHCKKMRRKFSDEVEELQAYAHDLRLTILRLRSRPVQRFNRWTHDVSSRFAFSRSLSASLLLVVIMAAAFYFCEQPVWTDGFNSSLEVFVLWKPFDEMLHPSWMTVSLISVATPISYFARRAKLHRAHALQLRLLKEFAATDPDQLIYQPRMADEASEDAAAAPLEIIDEQAWFELLGVSPSASMDEVKQAYKLRIKQNHPDRVHDMSPIFRKLADAETKKLNAAYGEAVSFFRQEQHV